ncbi:hypothetical protein ACO0QE_002706 [Hanseniaspora vineae]
MFLGGIESKNEDTIVQEFEPPISSSYSSSSSSGKAQKKTQRKSKKQKSPIPFNSIKHSYHLELKQKLSSLNSSRDNNNSTTGYVLWQTTPFFIAWLLYHTDHYTLEQNFDLRNFVFNSNIIELGSGVSGVSAVILPNYLNKSNYYVATDQKGLLSTLKENVINNKNEIIHNVKPLKSVTMNWCKPLKESFLFKNELDSQTEEFFHIEVEPLDWEYVTTQKLPCFVEKALGDSRSENCTILAMDVIYNDFLIKPFLDTLETLFKKWGSENHSSKITKSDPQNEGKSIKAIMGLQLRAQDVVQDFLMEAVLEYEFNVHVLHSEYLNSSRFCFYVISPSI